MTPEDIQYWFEERAAILEYCEGYSREEAERRAMCMTIRRWPKESRAVDWTPNTGAVE